MAIAYCPDCEGTLKVGPEPKLGQQIICIHCDAELEIVSLSPLEVDWIYYDEEDESWEEDEEEEEEDDDEDWDDEDDDWDDEDWDDDDLDEDED